MANDGPHATKAERLEEFLRRLRIAAPASSFEEAFQQLSDILNAVEDEMTSIAFDPNNWQIDGRCIHRNWTISGLSLGEAM